MPVTSCVVTGTALRAAFRSRSAVDVRKAPSSPNGHGPPGRLSVAAGAGGGLLPPKPPHPFPSALLPGEESGKRGNPASMTSGACRGDKNYLLKLFVKLVLTGPRTFSVCKLYGPAFHGKNAVFPLGFGRTALCSPPRVPDSSPPRQTANSATGPSRAGRPARPTAADRAWPHAHGRCWPGSRLRSGRERRRCGLSGPRPR